ncbi:MAG: hypothetical protein ACTS5I_11945, partial [Rhodanobacter sp.]
MKRIILGATLAVALVGALGWSANADPVDDELYIDDLEMITRATAPEGHPFEEVLSGWLFREAETRAVEADSFSNPAMLHVERGAEIWATVDGTEGKSCASCHDDAAVSMAGV